MTIRFPVPRGRVAALACVAAALLAPWPARAELGMNHLAALEGALHACGEARIMSEVMRLEVDEAVVQGYMHADSADAAAERFAPLYAHISESEAVRLDAWCQGAGGRVVVRQHIHDAARSMKGLVRVPVKSSASERRAAEVALRDTAAVLALRRLYTAPDGARSEAQRWMNEMVLGRGNYFGEFADVMQTLVDRPEQEVTPMEGDGSAMGRLVHVVGKELNALVVLRRQHDEAITALAQSAPMDGATLIDPKRIAASRECLDRVRATLNASLATMETYPDRVRAQIAQHNLPPALAGTILKGVEHGATQLYDWSLRLGENQRAIMRVYDAALTLAEAEAGHLRYQDGTLLFEHDDALARYRALVAEVTELIAGEERLLAEQRDNAQATIRKLRAADSRVPQ